MRTLNIFISIIGAIIVGSAGYGIGILTRNPDRVIDLWTPACIIIGAVIGFKLFSNIIKSDETKTISNPHPNQDQLNLSSTNDKSKIMIDFDNIKEIKDIGSFLKRYTENDILSFIETFPFSELRIDYKSIEKDFHNNQRMESILYLSSMLLRWSEYSSDIQWQGLLPRTLNASILYNKLSSRLFNYLKSQQNTDIAMNIRSKIYDFAMDLIRENNNREASICLEVSRNSPHEDHDFWLCACYYNIGKVENDIEAINKGLTLAQEIINNNDESSVVLQKLNQIDLLGKLKKLASGS